MALKQYTFNVQVESYEAHSIAEHMPSEYADTCAVLTDLQWETFGDEVELQGTAMFHDDDDATTEFLRETIHTVLDTEDFGYDDVHIMSMDYAGTHDEDDDDGETE